MSADGVTLIATLNGSSFTQGMLQAIQRVEIVQDDFGRSGFEVEFQASRSDAASNVYGQLVALVPQSDQRVVLSVQFGSATAVILMDGLILKVETEFDATKRTASFIATGEDISVVMDLEEKIAAFATEDEAAIVTGILGSYASYVTANVVAPATDITPVQNVYLPIQRATDRAYIEELAKRYGHKVYVNFKSPTSELYWGPPVVTAGQPDLIYTGEWVDNVNSLNIEYNMMAPKKFVGNVQDRDTDVVSALDVETVDTAGLAESTSAALTNQTRVRKMLSNQTEGRLQTEAQAWTQAAVDASTAAVTVEGELDSARYGQALAPRSSVNLRGVHATLDGAYYVQKVTHVIRPLDYTQRFVLLREGIDSSGG